MLDAGEDPVVPGVCVFSRRAAPLAGWTNGLELARLEADSGRACLILETGVADRWTYGQYPRTPQAKEEADAWNAAKVREGAGTLGEERMCLGGADAWWGGAWEGGMHEVAELWCGEMPEEGLGGRKLHLLC